MLANKSFTRIKDKSGLVIHKLQLAALEIREKSWWQKIAIAMSEFNSKSEDNFLDMFPTNFNLEYMKSIYPYSYDIHFKADWT